MGIVKKITRIIGSNFIRATLNPNTTSKSRKESITITGESSGETKIVNLVQEAPEYKLYWLDTGDSEQKNIDVISSSNILSLSAYSSDGNDEYVNMSVTVDNEDVTATINHLLENITPVFTIDIKFNNVSSDSEATITATQEGSGNTLIIKLNITSTEECSNQYLRWENASMDDNQLLEFIIHDWGGTGSAIFTFHGYEEGNGLRIGGTWVTLGLDYYYNGSLKEYLSTVISNAAWKFKIEKEGSTYSSDDEICLDYKITITDTGTAIGDYSSAISISPSVSEETSIMSPVCDYSMYPTNVSFIVTDSWYE